tara:strand:+ start:399 stop:1199 length:801 start_codon:yes stop_codon:yes gene_type:complete
MSKPEAKKVTREKGQDTKDAKNKTEKANAKLDRLMKAHPVLAEKYQLKKAECERKGVQCTETDAGYTALTERFVVQRNILTANMGRREELLAEVAALLAEVTALGVSDRALDEGLNDLDADRQALDANVEMLKGEHKDLFKDMDAVVMEMVDASKEVSVATLEVNVATEEETEAVASSVMHNTAFAGKLATDSAASAAATEKEKLDAENKKKLSRETTQKKSLQSDLSSLKNLQVKEYATFHEKLKGLVALFPAPFTVFADKENAV